MNPAEQRNRVAAARAETSRPQRFLVGKSRAGHWVARDEQGCCGGLFASHADALHFARREVGDKPCAVVLVTEPLELFVGPGDCVVANENPMDDASARTRRVNAGPARLWAQGDILIQQVEDGPVPSQTIRPSIAGSVLVAEGEAPGHRHRIFGPVTMYHDVAQNRSMLSELYVAHLHVSGQRARLEHEEHAPIILEQGTYLVRRQRQLEPTDVDGQEDFVLIED
jgi:hypothetical protein